MTPPPASSSKPAAARPRRKALLAAVIALPLLALAAKVVFQRTKPDVSGTALAVAQSQPADGTVDLTFKSLEFDPGPAFTGVHVTSNMAVKIPPEILALDGKYVRITGFLVPILNVSGRIREFFIMGSQNSCCFGKPPRLFDFIDAKMPQGADATYTSDPVVFEGVLHVRKTPAEDEWIPLFTMDCADVYR
jgi:hypothetical protein